MSTIEQDVPCLQKPRSYQGQSLILDSGSMCRNGHSLLLHSPAADNTGTLTRYALDEYSHYAHLCEFMKHRSLRTKLGVEVAFRHFGHVVFVEELALVSLLTQSSEPVLTHHRLLSADVTERTHPTWEWKQKKKELQHGRWHSAPGDSVSVKTTARIMYFVYFSILGVL